MGNTSTAVKNRYNKKAYKNFSVRLKPDLYERLDVYCKNNNLSRSQLLQKAIDLFDIENASKN